MTDLKKRHGGVPYLIPKELADCQKDPAWEAHQGITNRVACRKCGAMITSGNLVKPRSGHIWRRHRMTLQEYKAAYPGVPGYSLQLNAERSGSNVHDLVAKRIGVFLTPKELAICRKSPTWERDHGLDVVVCRVCGRKIASLLSGANHLNQHGLKLKDYRAKYPGAPWRTAVAIDQNRQGMKRLHAKRSAELARLKNLEAALKDGKLLKFPEPPPKQGGCTKDITKQTAERIDLAGELLAKGVRDGRRVSQRSICVALFPDRKDTPDVAYGDTRQLFSRFRKEIDAARDRYLALWTVQEPSA